jgi:vacuolar-type H+-ATPase subunit H
MDDHEVLQHLLNLETKSATLVDEAQAEADRRIAEGEKQNRLRYDEAYAQEVEALETSFTQTIAALREDCRKQLEFYRDVMKRTPLDTEAFSSLAEKLLFREP